LGKGEILKIDFYILRNAPELMTWLIGVILALIMLRRGGTRIEKLLLIGCSFMLAVSIISPIINELIKRWSDSQQLGNISTAQIRGFVRLPALSLNFTGIICLVWAFWLRFRVKRWDAV